MSNCVFCKIIDRQLEANILFENESLIIFTDHQPAAEHHYLVVPKEHLQDAKSLTSEHLSLVQDMKKAGLNVLKDRNGSLEDMRVGYHWPPCTLVKHLHLHILSPVSSMSYFQRFIFKLNSPWFATQDWLENRLASMSDNSNYIGDNIKNLIERSDGTYVFRLHNNKVYYVSEKTMKLAAHIPRENIIGLGTCFGKFTKHGKFMLAVTALDYLAPYAKFKVWIKPGAEQQFLYGNHVLKSGLGRITDRTDQYQGVVIYSMSDTPLGFGVAAKSTEQCRHADPMTIVIFHQADVGEYIRNEDEIA